MLKVNVPLLMLSICAALVVGVPSKDATVAGTCEEFAHKIIDFSSQHDTDKYSAKQALGHYDVYPEYGDNHNAWCPDKRERWEFLEFEFPTMSKIQTISIYETYHAGAVARVGLYNPNKDKYITVYDEATQDLKYARIFEPAFEPRAWLTNRVRLDLYCADWCEIDAVKITGSNCQAPEGTEFYVSTVIAFSSERDEPLGGDNHHAVQVIGEPNVYPKYDDNKDAWCPKNKGSAEFLELEFPGELSITTVSIYETFHAGAVTKIGIYDPKTKDYKKVYENPTPQDIDSARIFEPKLKLENAPATSDRIRLDLFCYDWCQIDAVKVTNA